MVISDCRMFTKLCWRMLPCNWICCCLSMSAILQAWICTHKQFYLPKWVLSRMNYQYIIILSNHHSRSANNETVDYQIKVQYLSTLTDHLIVSVSVVWFTHQLLFSANVIFSSCMAPNNKQNLLLCYFSLLNFTSASEMFDFLKLLYCTLGVPFK